MKFFFNKIVLLLLFTMSDSNEIHVANDSDNVDISNTYSSLLHEELTRIIRNFDKMNMKEIEPTTQNINENICEEDLSIVVDELINLTFKDLNKGNEDNVRKQHIFDYINNHKLNLQEIYNWLLSNQNNNSNSNYFLGYFNYHGIETNINKQ